MAAIDGGGGGEDGRYSSLRDEQRPPRRPKGKQAGIWSFQCVRTY